MSQDRTTNSLEQLLDEKQVIVVCGTGGVGKTTISASLAIAAASRGRRALVCTIDPARRLASSLGLEALGNEEVRIEAERLRSAGINPTASLHALMLDTKSTFDRLIERHAPDVETRDRILSNQIYQEISGQVTGSQEFMAMEKLYELHQGGRYDLVVLDTPPSQHVLDFLNAPRIMTEVLDGDMLRGLVQPYLKAGDTPLGMLQRSAKMVLRWMADLVGKSFIEGISEFFRSFEGIYKGFRERAAQVDELLKDREKTGFFLVTSPAWNQRQDGRHLIEALRQHQMPLEAVVVNRVRRGFGDAMGDARQTSQTLIGDALAGQELASARRLIEAFRHQQSLAATDQQVIEDLRRSAGAEVTLRTVPCFDSDVHDLQALGYVFQALFETQPTQEPLRSE